MDTWHLHANGHVVVVGYDVIVALIPMLPVGTKQMFAKTLTN